MPAVRFGSCKCTELPTTEAQEKILAKYRDAFDYMIFEKGTTIDAAVIVPEKTVGYSVPVSFSDGTQYDLFLDFMIPIEYLALQQGGVQTTQVLNPLPKMVYKQYSGNTDPAAGKPDNSKTEIKKSVSTSNKAIAITFFVVGIALFAYAWKH